MGDSVADVAGVAGSVEESGRPMAGTAGGDSRAMVPSTCGNSASDRPLRGRFAPTPSGRMHLGNVWCALLAWLDVRSRGGELVLRIEDLDRRKVPAGAEEALLYDLRWLGLDWDGEEVRQSDRGEIYAGYLERLVEAGLTYPCFCSRADLHAAEAPHASDGVRIYAGTCRNLTPQQIAEKRLVRHPGTRLVVPPASDPSGIVGFVDDVYGPYEECLAEECGDFVVLRSDGVFAYQLAKTVDDHLMGVNRVVRGRDLMPSTARQIYIQRLLGFEQPSYAHVPLLLAASGERRLSKRERDCDLGFMRGHFGRPEVLLGRLAKLGGLRPTDEPVSAADLAQSFTWDFLTSRSENREDIPVPGWFFS